MFTETRLVRVGAKFAFTVLAEKVNNEKLDQKNISKSAIIAVLDEWGTGEIIKRVKGAVPFDISIVRYLIRIGLIYGVYMSLKQKPTMSSIIIHVASLESPSKFGLA